METNDNIVKKLNYLGLDLNKLPKSLTEFENLNFRPVRNYSEKNYKVYKYIDVKDIQILLTPTNRLADLKEKYTKSVPICAYLNSEDKEDIEHHTEFLKLLKNIRIEDIEAQEVQQKKLQNGIPFSVKYYKDYLWQIYYSEDTDKYFMLAPINETEYAALFYLLKKQLEGKNEKIYVPICYSDYSQKILTGTEIEEIENYMWYFTKKWPLIYETYDKEENLELNIVGKTVIYENIESDYKINLKNKDEARDFYRLIKALFILQTELPHYYKFNIKLDKDGEIKFYDEAKEINFEILTKSIKNEYIKATKEAVTVKEEIVNLDKKLISLKEIISKLEAEYLNKERQISTFLECKKTFMGRVKYFFKYKKKKLDQEEKNEKAEKNIQKQTLHYFEKPEIKEFYTIEEIITIYKNLDTETAKLKNLQSDIKALEEKINLLNAKIKNANLYIKEIDDHKKSIFEFWKFTNKDEKATLAEGAKVEQPVKKLKKTFNYELDYSDFGEQLDKKQRNILTKEEINSAFIASTEFLEDLNDLLQTKEITENRLQDIKQQAKEANSINHVDIFGASLESRTSLKMLANKRHRETEKNKFNILKISENMSVEEYTKVLKNTINNLEEALKKMKTDIDIPVFKVSKENLQKNIDVFHINPEKAVNDLEGEINLYKVNIPDGTNILGMTNIVYYDNSNLTLPTGMNVTDLMLVDMREKELKLKTEDEKYILKYDETKDVITTIKMKIYEYDI